MKHRLPGQDPRTGRNNNFDLLRLVAASAVLLSHSFAVVGDNQPQIGGYTLGTIAVYVFFAISGYLIVGSWSYRPELGAFLAKRALRIVPAYLAMLLIVAFVLGPILTTWTAAAYFHSGWPVRFVTQNLTFTPHLEYALPGVFGNLTSYSVNSSIWTLPFEVRAYLLVAVLGLLGAFRNRTVGAITLAVVIVATGFIKHTPDLWNPVMLRMFAVGGIIWLLRERLPLRGWLAVAGCGSWLLLSGTSLGPWFAALSIPYATVVVAYRSPRGWAQLTRFGDFSYGLYVWGWVVQQTTLSLLPGLSPFELFALALPVSYGVGAVSWFAIEQPMLRLKTIGVRVGRAQRLPPTEVPDRRPVEVGD